MDVTEALAQIDPGDRHRLLAQLTAAKAKLATSLLAHGIELLALTENDLDCRCLSYRRAGGMYGVLTLETLEDLKFDPALIAAYLT